MSEVRSTSAPSATSAPSPAAASRAAGTDAPRPTTGQAVSPVRATLPDGTTAWVVSRYADVRSVLSDPRFSSDDQRPDFPRLLPLPPLPGALSFLRMDPPRHDVLRRVLTPQFTVRRIEALRPGIQLATDKLLDAMEAGGPPADLVECFALPLPSLVICRLLGVPYQDHDMFQRHSRNIVATDVSAETAAASLLALEQYLAALVVTRRNDPADDLISAALARQEAADLSDADIVAMARLMLIAGHETTANMINMSVLALFRQPERADALRDADPELLRSAVEELLRFLSVVRNGIGRVATAEVQLTDITVAAGEGVVVDLRGANHDDEAFPAPAELDLHRAPRGHVAFGYGIHQCIGQALARVELQVALGTLLRRFPALRPAVPLDEVTVREHSVVIGATSLPVAW